MLVATMHLPVLAAVVSAVMAIAPRKTDLVLLQLNAEKGTMPASVHDGKSGKGGTLASVLVTEGSEVVSETDDSSDCPTRTEAPTVLWNHISKTGGTAVAHMLKEIFDKHNVTIQEDKQHNAHITAEDKHNFYVLGSVRRPCDYLVSWYYEKEQNDLSFEGFVERVLNKKSHVPLMSEALATRYGSGDNVHCMIRAHSLKDDFVGCMRKYKACGGFLNEEALDGQIETALKQAQVDAHSHGRSVGDHPSCTSLFNQDMMTSVLRTEQAVIDEFDLGSCCT